MHRSDYISLAHAMANAGAQPESILAALRLEGASQGESALALGRTGRWTVKEVKELVDASATWADHAADRAAFIEAVVDHMDSKYGKPGDS